MRRKSTVGIAGSLSSNDLRRSAKRVLRTVPPVSRVVANMTNPGSRGHRLEAGLRTVSFDVRTRLLGRPTVARIGEHSRIIVYRGESNGFHAACRNPPNWPEMGVWRQHLQPGDLFLDIGANIGIYTLFALDLGAEVIACEPDLHNAERLQENLTLNGYTAEVVQKALSDRPGVLRFTQGLDSYNHLVLKDAVPDAAATVEVEATTVDELLGDRVASGVKLDVEGAERLVLAGAARALRERRIRLLQLEWSDPVAHRTLGEGRGPVSTLLADAGYVLHSADRRTAELRPVGDGPIPRKDVFAVPA